VKNGERRIGVPSPVARVLLIAMGVRFSGAESVDGGLDLTHTHIGTRSIVSVRPEINS
jgi:hypothetical protein